MWTGREGHCPGECQDKKLFDNLNWIPNGFAGAEPPQRLEWACEPHLRGAALHVSKLLWLHWLPWVLQGTPVPTGYPDSRGYLSSYRVHQFLQITPVTPGCPYEVDCIVWPSLI